MNLIPHGLWLALMAIILTQHGLSKFYNAITKAGNRMEEVNREPLVPLLGGTQGGSKESATAILRPFPPSTVGSAFHRAPIMRTVASIVVIVKSPVLVGRQGAVIKSRWSSPVPIPATHRHAPLSLPMAPVYVPPANASTALNRYVPSMPTYGSCPAISRATYRDTCPNFASMVKLSTAIVPINPTDIRAAVGGMDYGLCASKAPSKALVVALPAAAKQLMPFPLALPCSMTAHVSTCLVMWSMVKSSMALIPTKTVVGDIRGATSAIKVPSKALSITLPAAAKQLMTTPVVLNSPVAAPIILEPLNPPSSVCKALIPATQILVVSPPFLIKVAAIGLLSMSLWSATSEDLVVVGYHKQAITYDVSYDVTPPVGVTHECTAMESKEGEGMRIIVAVDAGARDGGLEDSALGGDVCRALPPWDGDMCPLSEGDDVAREEGQADPEVAPILPTSADDGCVGDAGEDASLVPMRAPGESDGVEGVGCGSLERGTWSRADVFNWLAGLLLFVLGAFVVRQQIGGRHEVHGEMERGEYRGSGQSTTKPKGLLAAPTGAGDSFDEPPQPNHTPLNNTKAQVSGSSGGEMVTSAAPAVEPTANPTPAFIKPCILITSTQGPTSGSEPKRLVLRFASGPTNAELHMASFHRLLAPPFESLLTWPRSEPEHCSPLLPYRLDASRIGPLSEVIEPLVLDGGFECIATLSLAPVLHCPALLLLCVGPSTVRFGFYRHVVSRAFSPRSAKNAHLRSIPGVRANGLHRFVLALDCVVEGSGEMGRGLKACRERLGEEAARACRIMQALHDGGETAVTELFGPERILSARLLTPSERVTYTDDMRCILETLQTFIDRTDAPLAEKSRVRFLYGGNTAPLQKGKQDTRE